MKETSVKNQKAITLIALVITIIVLLILAGVSIATLTGESGIFIRAKEAKEKDVHGKVYEAFILETQTYKIKRETGAVEVTLIEYLQEKEILSSDYQINVEKLVGKKLSLGNGTNGVNDIYKLEKVIETAKLASTEKITIEKSEENVKYKIVYYGQEVGTVVESVDIGDVVVGKRDALEDHYEIFEYEDEARTILKGIKSEFKKEYGTDDKSKKESSYYEIIKDGKRISEIMIPSGVTTIRDKAFFCYPYLTINLPSSVEIIGTQAFYDCDTLKVAGKSSEVHFDEVGENAFVHTEVIYLVEPEIDYANLFTYREGDKSIITGIDAQFIKEYLKNEKEEYKAIVNKYGEVIKEITIPNGVTRIESESFVDYIYLTINVPSNVKELGDRALYYCDTVNIEGKSSNVYFEKYGENAIVATNVIYLGKPVVDYEDLFMYEDEARTIITGINPSYVRKYTADSKSEKDYVSTIFNKYDEHITEITIPNGVTEIKEKAFFGYSNLIIDIPSSVKVVGDYALYYCDQINVHGKSSESDFITVGKNAFKYTTMNFINN